MSSFSVDEIRRASDKARWIRDLDDIAEAFSEDDEFGLLGIEFMWHHLNSDAFDESWLPDRSVLEDWAVAFLLCKGTWLHLNYGDIKMIRTKSK